MAQQQDATEVKEEEIIVDENYEDEFFMAVEQLDQLKSAVGILYSILTEEEELASLMITVTQILFSMIDEDNCYDVELAMVKEFHLRNVDKLQKARIAIFELVDSDPLVQNILDDLGYEDGYENDT